MKNVTVTNLALWGMMLCASAAASSQDQSQGTAASTIQSKGPYWDGMRAINEAHWADAEAIFTKNYGQPGSQFPDGSLYWKAYAQNKLQHSKDALATCAQLQQSFPASNWLHECRALEIEAHASLGHPVEPQAEKADDLKLLALNWLMLKDESRALADLQEILSGDSSEDLKQKAILILGQHYSDATYDEIVRIRYVEGDVRITRGEGTEKNADDSWEQATANLPLETGFSLTTGDNGRAEIELEDASTIYLAENSVLTFNDLHTTSGVPYTEMALLSGTVSLAIQSTIAGEAFVLRTPTDDFAVRYPHKSHARISSYSDAMAITAQDANGLQLNASLPKEAKGETLAFRQGRLVFDPDLGDAAAFDNFDQWAADRLAQHSAAMTEVMQAAGLTTALPGLADMKGQGTFFACPPYGTCWEPATAESQRPAVAAARPAPRLVRASFDGASFVRARLDPPRFAPAQLVDPLDPFANPQLDTFSPCFPSSVRYSLMKDPVTGRARVVDTGMVRGVTPWDWAVCHAGAWVHVPRRHHYVWCAGQKRHHVAPVQWVKSGRTVGFVPMHPFDVKGRPPMNRTQEVYTFKHQNGLQLQRVTFDPKNPISTLKEPPHEFRNSLLRPLSRASAPHMEARPLGARLTASKTTGGKSPVSAPVARPVGTPIRFDAKSQSFMVSRTEMHGGKSVTISAPMANHSGTLQAHGGSFSGGHSGSSGGGSHGGGGSASGGHAGGGGGSSGGGGHSGGGGGSSGGSSGGGASSGGGGGGHH